MRMRNCPNKSPNFDLAFTGVGIFGFISIRCKTLIFIHFLKTRCVLSACEEGRSSWGLNQAALAKRATPRGGGCDRNEGARGRRGDEVKHLLANRLPR